MPYDAIALDTQTVAANGYNLDGGLLEQLKQFKDGPARVVLSEVVLREIYKHLHEKTKNARDALVSAQRKALECGLLDKEKAIFEADAGVVEDAVKARLNKFIKDIGAIIIPPDDVKTKELLRRYFGSQPPFAAAGKKKNEFPDAIALLSLEGWASTNDKRILAVSGDKDWSDFAAGSDRMDVMEDLSDALALLQEHGEQAQAIAQDLLTKISTGDEATLTSNFERLLENEVGGYHVYAEADSIGHVETDQIDLSYVSSDFLSNEDQFDFVVVQDRDSIIVVRLNVVLHVLAEGSFGISVHDSIDDDYVSLGSTSASVEADLEVSLLVTFEGDREGCEFSVSQVTIVSGPQTIDFGHLSPDYESDYEPDYEPDAEEEERPEIEYERPERDESEHR